MCLNIRGHLKTEDPNAESCWTLSNPSSKLEVEEFQVEEPHWMREQLELAAALLTGHRAWSMCRGTNHGRDSALKRSPNSLTPQWSSRMQFILKVLYSHSKWWLGHIYSEAVFVLKAQAFEKLRKCKFCVRCRVSGWVIWPQASIRHRIHQSLQESSHGRAGWEHSCSFSLTAFLLQPHHSPSPRAQLSLIWLPVSHTKQALTQQWFMPSIPSCGAHTNTWQYSVS